MRKKIFWFVALLFVTMWAHHVWLRVGKPEMNDAVRKEFHKKSINLSSGATAYELFVGEGTPVVLVNGFSMPSVVWENIFNALKDEGHTVLRYDLFGRGFSDRPNAKYNADFFAGQLKEITEKLLPKQKIILCGLSMGGAISVYFTDKFAASIEKIILIAPAGFPMETPLTAKLATLPGIGDYLGRVAANNALEKSMVNGVATKMPEKMAAVARVQTRYAGYADAIVSTLRHMNLTGLEAEYARVGQKSIPTLLIWGKKDLVVPFANAQRVRSAITHAEFLPLDNAGHIPTIDEPVKTERAILNFIQD